MCSIVDDPVLVVFKETNSDIWMVPDVLRGGRKVEFIEQVRLNTVS